MAGKKLFIPILLGTARRGRQSEKVARFLHARAVAHSRIETRLFDPRDMQLPNDDEGEALKDVNPEWRDAVTRADGLIIVSPEYNHGYPGTLKRVLDMLLKEYIHKAVAICSVSKGGFGGVRMTEALVNTVRELGLVATFTDLAVSRVREVFNEEGSPKDATLAERTDAFFEELIWMAETLRKGRAEVPSRYHSGEDGGV